jgi:RNA polymerase sigma factor (sigma-70 family)
LGRFPAVNVIVLPGGLPIWALLVSYASAGDNTTTMTAQNSDDYSGFFDDIFAASEEVAKLAFGRLTELLRERLRRYAMSTNRNTATADDLVQDALIKTWGALRAGKIEKKTPAEFRSYVLQRLKWLICDGKRRGSGTRTSGSAGLEFVESPDLSPRHATDDQMLGGEEQLKQLRECIEKLRVAKPEYYAIAIRKLGALPVVDIASQLNLSKQAVHKRFHSAKEWLKRCVQGGIAA